MVLDKCKSLWDFIQHYRCQICRFKKKGASWREITEAINRTYPELSHISESSLRVYFYGTQRNHNMQAVQKFVTENFDSLSKARRNGELWLEIALENRDKIGVCDMPLCKVADALVMYFFHAAES